jgi:hypothetical protein
MMHNWTKSIPTQNEDDQKYQKIHTKDIINGNVYVEKNYNFNNNLWHIV